MGHKPQIPLHAIVNVKTASETKAAVVDDLKARAETMKHGAETETDEKKRFSLLFAVGILENAITEIKLNLICN